MAFKIDSSCNNCGLCADKCPTRAISRHGNDDSYVIDSVACIECGNCRDVCPNNSPNIVNRKKISLANLIEQERYQVVYMPKPAEEIFITNANTNRPGLLLSGYNKFFDPTRLQFIGLMEHGYIESLESEEKIRAIRRLMENHPPAVILTRGQEEYRDMIEFAKQYEVPVLRTTDTTSLAMASASYYLSEQLAPTIQRHGVLVEVYGEGILLLGESGVGKSETAIELVKRGHRLIADDAVEIRRVSNKSLVGTAPDNIRHFIELRGIGIINASRIFGVGAVKLTEKIDLVINMEPWDVNKTYDRMGLENQTTDILGLDIPSLTIPVKPGRNLAVIIEVAAMNSRQKKLGYNAAEDLLSKLGMNDDFKKPEEVKVKPF